MCIKNLQKSSVIQKIFVILPSLVKAIFGALLFYAITKILKFSLIARFQLFTFSQTHVKLTYN